MRAVFCFSVNGAGSVFFCSWPGRSDFVFSPRPLPGRDRGGRVVYFFVGFWTGRFFFFFPGRDGTIVPFHVPGRGGCSYSSHARLDGTVGLFRLAGRGGGDFGCNFLPGRDGSATPPRKSGEELARHSSMSNLAHIYIGTKIHVAVKIFEFGAFGIQGLLSLAMGKYLVPGLDQDLEKIRQLSSPRNSFPHSVIIIHHYA